MRDRTIDSALFALRVQLVREDQNGFEHVEALLRMRRVPMPGVRRAPRQAFKRRELQRELAALLRDRPLTSRGIADRVQEAHGFTRRRPRDTVDKTLAKTKRAGWARIEDGPWFLSIDSHHSKSATLLAQRVTISSRE